MGWAAAAAAVVGAIAGGQKDAQTGQNYSSSATGLRSAHDLNLGRSAGEEYADNNSLSNYKSMQAMTDAGPGQQDVANAYSTSNQYADMLSQMMQNGGMVNQTQIGQANDYAKSIFAPQQTALQQSFVDQNQQSARMAARLGRGGNDPILQNKLATEQTRQQQMLNSQQGAFSAQFADQMPQRQLSMMDQLHGVRQGLATQAFANRQNMFTLGQQLISSERNFRMGAATHDQFGTQLVNSGGGFKGAVAGGFAGAGAVMGKGGGGGAGGGGGGASGGGGYGAAGGGADMGMMA